MTYLAISFIFLLISTFLFKKVSGSLKPTKINMISWIFYYNLIIQSFIASVLIINNIDNHYIVDKINHDQSRFYGWLAVQYTMIAMPLGMIILNKLLKVDNKKLFTNYLRSNIKPFLSLEDSYILYPFYILSIASILSVVYVILSLDGNPLLGVIQGLDPETLAGMRVKSSREFLGNEYVKNIFALGLTPILSYIAYAYYKMTKNIKNLFVFILLFIASFFILTYNIEKAPLLTYLLGFSFLTVLINGSIKKKTLVVLLALSVVAITSMYVLLSDVENTSDLFFYNSGIIGRLILSQAAATYLSFDLFPAIYPHIGFSSASDFLNSIFDIQTTERSARIIMMYINPKGIIEGHAGVINTLFIGEAWANFGIAGVLIAPIYVGIIIQALFVFFLKMPKTPILLGVFTYFSYKGSVTGGFNDYFYNAGYLAIFIIIFLLYISGLILKKIK